VILRLRSLLRKAPLGLADIDLNDIIRETVDLLAAIAVARGVELRSSISGVPLPIRGDRIQLQQVTTNLIMNAMDAVSDLPSAERSITLSTARNGSVAELSISDVGPGIPPDKLHDIFTPFFSTKENGMGMGLSITRTIIEAHNGKIIAENQPNGGAVFRVRLSLTS